MVNIINEKSKLYDDKEDPSEGKSDYSQDQDDSSSSNYSNGS